jgi:hypothetical protein
MYNITGRITVVLTAACLLALLVVTVSAGFSGTLLGPGPGSSQSLTIASLNGDNQWSSASLISQISSNGFGTRTHSVLENWVPPVNQVYTTPTRQMPSFMNSDGNPAYDWDTLFAKPIPYCGCGCS